MTATTAAGARPARRRFSLARLTLTEAKLFLGCRSGKDLGTYQEDRG